MNTPQRIQLSRRKDWRMPPNTVKVCRPGMWGNPFKVAPELTAASSVKQFRAWLGGADWSAWMWAHHRAHMLSDEVRSSHPYDALDVLLQRLRGKNLACFCPIGSPCHADVLLELANAPLQDSPTPTHDSLR